MDRLIPRLKTQSAPVEAPFHIGEGDSLADQGRWVLEAAFSGLLPPDQANELLTALVAQAGIIEISDLVQRVEALERGDTGPAAVAVRPFARRVQLQDETNG